MQGYWVYLWAYQNGAYRDSETFVYSTTASDALLAVMQQRQLSFVDDAVVVADGSHVAVPFHCVSLALVQEVL